MKPVSKFLQEFLHTPGFSQNPAFGIVRGYQVVQIRNLEAKYGTSFKPRTPYDTSVMCRAADDILHGKTQYGPIIKRAQETADETVQRIAVDAPTAMSHIQKAEMALDSDEFTIANTEFSSLASMAITSQSPVLKQYLDLTAGLRRDLSLLEQSGGISHDRNAPLDAAIKEEGKESALEQAAKDSPISFPVIQRNRASDVAAIKQKINEIGPFHVDPKEYTLPLSLNEPSIENIHARIQAINSFVVALDSRIAPLRTIESFCHDDATLHVVTRDLGVESANTLNARSSEVSQAESTLSQLKARLQGSEQLSAVSSDDLPRALQQILADSKELHSDGLIPGRSQDLEAELSMLSERVHDLIAQIPAYHYDHTQYEAPPAPAVANFEALRDRLLSCLCFLKSSTRCAIRYQMRRPIR
jgi:hypothetical protein